MRREYRVYLHSVGDIGYVVAERESEARVAALCKYGEEGLRPKGFKYTSERPPKAIYEDDDFQVKPV